MAYSFGGLIHYGHGGKHGGRQADLVLEELEFLHLDPQATGKNESTRPSLNFWDLKDYP